METMRASLLIPVTAWCMIGAGQESPLDVSLARRYFQEARWASEDDGGRLWGRALYGPMVFVDPGNRSAVANEQPPGDGFKESGGVFTGRLPDRIPLANYALEWQGTRWTMILWPLPVQRSDRTTLVMHELFHRIQPELGLPAASPANAHLETLEGRVWLQLEIQALARALATGEATERATRSLHALRFRAERQKLDAKAKREEDQAELNEGLAQYTGCALRGGSEEECRLGLSHRLGQAIGIEAYPRRFAYSTGAAYGFLLSLSEGARPPEESWRRTLKPGESLADRLRQAIGEGSGSAADDLEGIAASYGVEDLRKSEAERDRKRKEKAGAIRARLIEGPVLVLPLAKMRSSFRNDDVFSLGAEGTFFAAATLADEWGTLVVTSEGLVLSADRKTARVRAPAEAGAVSGPGWALKPAAGWKVVSAARAGDFTLEKQ